MSSTAQNREFDHGIPHDPTVEWTTPLAVGRNVVPNKRKCGLCGLTGHNKRTCPQKAQEGKLIVNNNGIVHKQA